MDFHIYLDNHHPRSFVLLEDVLQPIIAGLEEGGHNVACFSTEFVLAPRINVFVEFFRDPWLIETLISLKQRLGDQFIFGIICTEDLADPLVWQVTGPNRLEGLQRLLPYADFVWPLVAAEGYCRLVPPERVARIEYGYSSRLVPPCHFDAPADRDIDAVIYGSPYTYRMKVFMGLRELGLSSGFTVSLINDPVKGQTPQGLPRYLSDEVLARAKVVVDLRRGTDVRSLSVTRIAAAVHGGCTVVAEKFDEGETARFYRYTIPAGYDAIVETCRRIVREEDYIALGRAARERFRAETSMHDNMAKALRLPVFERLAGG